mmetsp:Transcript_30704/g.31224  ORF Transcript_30704/g.31224 Transcript_30704/m.31224 type:complete len:114 (-) Transcript_30704:176-517(-)
MPSVRSSLRASSYSGTMVPDHNGVKAPGSPNKTTRFPFIKESEVTSFQSNGFGSSDSIRTRVLKVTEGTVSPSLSGFPQASLIGGLKGKPSDEDIWRAVVEEKDCFCWKAPQI